MWLLQSNKEARPPPQTSERPPGLQRPSAFVNVLTPGNIPDFFIPRGLGSAATPAAHDPEGTRRPGSTPSGRKDARISLLPPDPLHVALRRAVRHLDGESLSSADSSPFGSPVMARSSSGALHSQLERATTASSGSLSADDGSVSSSADASPCVPRRLVPTCRDPPGPGTPVEVPLSRAGTVRLSALYAPECGFLRLRLISVEGAYGPRTDPRHIGCSVSVCLAPGKSQKQRSAVVRNTRNPIFNEDFFFENVSSGDLGRLSLQVKVVNKGGAAIKRDTKLGEAELCLMSLLASPATVDHEGLSPFRLIP
uniref:C2 calcium-dependent domain-containing protein 4C-like n=1 Tax=Myxine glutinosa TaxID=7769 RepID=UPI00358EC4F9